MYTNPNIAFFFHQGELIAWDAKNKQQFSITEPYFERLYQRAVGHEPLEVTPIDEELLEGGLLSPRPVAPNNWKGSLLAWLFHTTTRDTFAMEKVPTNPQQFDQEYLFSCAALAPEQPPFSREISGEKLKLPEPDSKLIENPSFLDILHKRYTCRNFHGKSINLLQLSTLLYYGAGKIHGDWEELTSAGLKEVGVRKGFPSAGGMHPEELYVVVFRVDGLANGVYHYDFRDHTLALIELGDFEDHIIFLCGGIHYFKGAAVGLFLTAQFARTLWKYPHSRSYRVSLLDVGHASQNLLLTTTALGLQTFITGVFHDSSVDKLLHIEDDNESPYVFIGIGHGEGSFSKDMMEKLKG